MLAPLPRLLCSVCLFGFTPTYKPMISQSHHHHHHHYQLTRDHYNPHSGFDAVSAPQSTAKEPDHSLYISLSSIVIVRPLLDYNLHCACHPHTDSLVFRLPSLFYGGCLFGSSCLVVASTCVTIRALILTYMGEEAQERRLATSTCPKATIPYERLLLYVHPPPDMMIDSMIRLILRSITAWRSPSWVAMLLRRSSSCRRRL